MIKHNMIRQDNRFVWVHRSAASASKQLVCSSIDKKRIEKLRDSLSDT